jgi:predicted MFS family arabinose efflux permease
MPDAPALAPAGPAPPAAAGAFTPLRHRLFLVLWAAAVLGNVGTFMRDVASAWLVVELSDSPSAVALVQAAGTLPIFLLAIPAGVLADIVDKRRLLIMIQIGLAAVSALLAVLAAIGTVSVLNLVALTFLGGVGAALLGPAWQAIVPDLVPRSELKSAVALNSLGINIARAIGPALGGAVLAGLGAAAVYATDVLTYVAVIAALLWWRRAETPRDALAEHFGGALRAGLRYARASSDLHRVLLRAALFFAAASAAWALLPLVARDLLGGGPGFYGLMLGGIGLGAIVGAVVLPRLREAVGPDRVVLAASLAAALVLGLLSITPPQWLGLAAMIVLGAAWIGVLTTLNATAQGVLPNWVRGRGLAVYLTVFNGAMTAGSLVWGAVADAVGLGTTLMIAAAALAAVGLLAHRWRLPAGEADLAPSRHWPEPLVAGELAQDRGPVLVTVTHRIREEDRPAFLALLHRLSEERRRDGAYAWGIAEDAADPERMVEWFFVESWAEHLRQHHRVSKADADLQAEARRFHIGDEPPKVAHFLALDARTPRSVADTGERKETP